jgi:hypothetical protein
MCQCSFDFKKDKKFCSLKCKNKFHGNSEFQIQRGLKRKIKYINERGGGCQKCGYNRNYAALCFHHRDPTLKIFEVELNKISCLSQERVNAEVQKCDILCHNCHIETHFPKYMVPGHGIEPCSSR